jgi:hypothetical protein
METNEERIAGSITSVNASCNTGKYTGNKSPTRSPTQDEHCSGIWRECRLKKSLENKASANQRRGKWRAKSDWKCGAPVMGLRVRAPCPPLRKFNSGLAFRRVSPKRIATSGDPFPFVFGRFRCKAVQSATLRGEVYGTIAGTLLEQLGATGGTVRCRRIGPVLPAITAAEIQGQELQRWVATMCCQWAEMDIRRTFVTWLLVNSCSSAEYFDHTRITEITGGNSTRE